MTKSEKLVAGIQKNRWVVLFLILISCFFAGKGVLQVGVDNSLEIWFVEDDPQLQTYQEFQDEYGNDEVVVLALHNASGILTQGGMESLHQLTQAAESVEGISEAYSLSNARGLDGGELGLNVSHLYDPNTPVSTEMLQKRVLPWPPC